jgi:hypothetical protein
VANIVGYGTGPAQIVGELAIPVNEGEIALKSPHIIKIEMNPVTKKPEVTLIPMLPSAFVADGILRFARPEVFTYSFAPSKTVVDLYNSVTGAIITPNKEIVTP